MKLTYTRVVIFFLLTIAQETFSQVKEFETREQTWLAYLNQARFTTKSGLWADLHYRLNDKFLKEAALAIGRFGYTYYLSDQTRLTAGYAYVTNFSLVPGIADVPEHRPWQQIQWFEKKSWYALMQYIRLEERYRRKIADGVLTDGYHFNFRVRYNVSMTIPLKGSRVTPKTPFMFLGDELHINFGKSIVNNYFDQNRLYAGVGYQFTAHLNAQVGYNYVFQQLPAGNRYVNTNAIRLFIFHNLDLRNNE